MYTSGTPHDALPLAGWADKLLWLARRRRRFQVTGDSMTPLLRAGDVVFVDPSAYRSRLPQVGDIVVARHPHLNGLKLVKRVQSASFEEGCFLMSDNQVEGTDSRVFGAVPMQKIIGRVTSRA